MVKDPSTVHPAFVQVLRIKPTMQFLRQVILNVVISPRVVDNETGQKRKMLYSDSQADSRKFAVWKNKFENEGGFHLKGAEALLGTPEIAHMEVRMVTEIQLYLSYFFRQRAQPDTLVVQGGASAIFAKLGS